jgi:hypothetical protein
MADKKVVSVPDGRGGWTTQEMEVQPGGKLDAVKAQAAQAKVFIDEAGLLTEQLLKFDVMYVKDHSLSKEHRAFAAALYCVNLRETYPDGPDAFDKIAEGAAKYYDDNKDKVR